MKDSDAPLSTSAGKQVISIDLLTVESLRHHLEQPQHPSASKHQELLDELLQLTLCKYGARPHWALSTNRMVFSGGNNGGDSWDGQREGHGGCASVRDKYGMERFDLFMERRARYDPQDLFLSPAFIKVASKALPERYPGKQEALV